MRKSLIVFVAVGLCLCLTGCSNDDASESDIVGTTVDCKINKVDTFSAITTCNLPVDDTHYVFCAVYGSGRGGLSCDWDHVKEIVK